MRELRCPSRSRCEHRSRQFHRRRRFRQCGQHTCEDEMRRRRLLTVGGVDVSFTISVDTAQHEESGRARFRPSTAHSSGIIRSSAASGNRSRHRCECQCHDQSDCSIPRLPHTPQPTAAPSTQGLNIFATAAACACLVLASLAVANTYVCVKGSLLGFESTSLLLMTKLKGRVHGEIAVQGRARRQARPRRDTQTRMAAAMVTP